jgi:hypothetical protein
MVLADHCVSSNSVVTRGRVPRKYCTVLYSVSVLVLNHAVQPKRRQSRTNQPDTSLNMSSGRVLCFLFDLVLLTQRALKRSRGVALP